MTYINNGIAVDDPHDAGLGVSGDTATETGPLALFYCYRIRSAHKNGWRTGLGLVYYLLRSPVKTINLKLTVDDNIATSDTLAK